MTFEKQSGILLDTGTNEVEFLRFTVCGNLYGINVAKVCQTMLAKEQRLTSLPQTPAAIMGSMYFREKPIPVIDLASALDLTRPTDYDEERQLLLITEFNGSRFAFVVDTVDGIMRCSWTDFVAIEDSLLSQTGESAVVGTVARDDKIVMILDVEAIIGAIIPSIAIESFRDKVPAIKEGLDRKNVRIVYCEDSAIVQKILLKTLESAGFEHIQTFPSGLDGLQFLEQADPSLVNFIISDIEMPQMDGLTLCKKVRELGKFGHVPFVFFSSMINGQMKEKCRSVGGNGAYSKPEVHHLVEIIDKWIAGGLPAIAEF